MFSRKLFLGFMATYFLVRIFSYFFGPPTPLSSGSIVNSAASILIILLASYWIIKKDMRGWLIIAAELILCGSGNILSVSGISLRTLLLAVSLSIFFVQTWREGRLTEIFQLKLPNMLVFLLIDWAAVSAVVGALNSHSLSQIISDFIPYLFFFYYFPLFELLANEKFRFTCFNLLAAALMSGAVFILLSYFSFCFGGSVLQGNYYHWFRDVAQGKITPVGYNFYRLVLNEQLLLVPLVLYFIYRNLLKPERINDFCLTAGSILLSLNLTRIYFIALAVGMIFLFSRKLQKQWLIDCAVVISLIFIFFTAFFLISSGGRDPGWSYFGFRFSSIASPQSEFSSLSRMVLLPQILYKIGLSPSIGQGLGDTVTVRSDLFFGQWFTTPHFDWGYLEIIDETGAVGIILWAALLFIAFRQIKKTGGLRPALTSVLISLIIINLTSPAIFHVMGVITIVIIMALNRVSRERQTALLQTVGLPESLQEAGKRNAAATG